jgi:hypothetical protein
MSRANGERRVLAFGTPASHSPTRKKFREVAVNRCWAWVFANPTYLERRASQVLTDRETVPSIPARLEYSALNSAVPSRCRAACRASYCSFGCTLMFRRGYLASESVHSWRLGQGPQSLAENFMRMTSPPRLSTKGAHPMLSWPSGQMAFSRSQSILKSCAPKPRLARAFPRWSPRVGPKRSTP